MKKAPMVILGGGLTGLSAAWQLEKKSQPYLLFEKEARPGGWARSQRVKGFTFDYTGHLLHLVRPESRSLLLDELGLKKRMTGVSKSSWAHLLGVYTRAPFQNHLYGLPFEHKKKCLLDFLNVWQQENKRKESGQLLKTENFDQWMNRTFGDQICDLFMRPYNTKLWGVKPEQMTTQWMGRFVPQPSARQLFAGAMNDQGEAAGYNAHFLYPRSGGIEVLPAAFAKKVKLQLNTEVVALDTRRRQLCLADGSRVDYSKLITTMPLKKLISMTAAVPPAVKKAAQKLRGTHVCNINLGIIGRNITDKQWIYVPEEKYPFYRVGFYHNFSKKLVPAGGSSVYAEMSYADDRPLPEGDLLQKVLSGLLQMKLLRRSDRIAAVFEARMKNAYVVYDSHRSCSVNTIQSWLREQDIISTGRWGNWEYGSMEDAIWQGISAADTLRGKHGY